MYAGHVGLALGAKGLRKALPLWALIIASQLPDWADASVCLAGINSPIPGMFSHSLPAIAILTIVGALVYLTTTRDVAGAAFVGALVISHVLGDYVTGLKPTWSGGPMIGLRLYQHPALDFVAEAVVILAGWTLYRASIPKDRQATLEAWTMLGFLLAIQALADVVFSVSPSLRKC